MNAFSVRARLTLWHASVLAAIVLAFAGAINLFVRAKVYGELDARLEQNLKLVEKTHVEDPGEIGELEDHKAVLLFDVTEAEKIIYRTELWRRGDFEGALIGPVETGNRSWDSPGGKPYRVSIATGQVSGKPYRVAVALDEDAARHTMKDLAFILLAGVPVSLALAVAGGYFLAGRLLSPIRTMADRAERITAENLSERLPVSNATDEFGRLAVVFNEALTRLHGSFEELRRFTSDASHELRTPLTAIRSVGEVALREARDPADYRDVIGSMLEEVDRLSRLVDTLLTLTRAEGGRLKITKELINLASFSRSVADHLRVLADEKEQTLLVEAAERVVAEADAGILRQSLTNLLDNAIKYTPPKGKITVSVRKSGGEAFIEVADTGPGIAAEHRDRVFERFYRIDEGRGRDSGGVGLGLALARWAVCVNGGRIELESKEKEGSLFRIVLPLRDGGPS
jgi:heavy metal sensor kinase